MKKVYIRNVDRFLKSTNVGDSMEEVYAEGETMSVSDGYHTFDELYEHRITLFIALCKAIATFDLLNPPTIWRSKLHSDGSSFDGWFILGMNKVAGRQVTYHLPLSKWEDTGFAETLEKAPEWDGHTANDVLNRLKLI